MQMKCVYLEIGRYACICTHVCMHVCTNNFFAFEAGQPNSFADGLRQFLCASAPAAPKQTYCLSTFEGPLRTTRQNGLFDVAEDDMHRKPIRRDDLDSGPFTLLPYPFRRTS